MEQTSSGLSSSSSASHADALSYVTVHFDDGPETGLVVDVSEDDACDPRYWRFQEVHGRLPAFKVLYDDGLTSFVTEKPAAPEGELVDEDGDRHGYIREERPQIQAAEAVKESSITEPPQRRGYGGWGHVVIEKVQEEASSDAPGKRAKRRRSSHPAQQAKRSKKANPAKPKVSAVTAKASASSVVTKTTGEEKVSLEPDRNSNASAEAPKETRQDVESEKNDKELVDVTEASEPDKVAVAADLAEAEVTIASAAHSDSDVEVAFDDTEEQCGASLDLDLDQ